MTVTRYLSTCLLAAVVLSSCQPSKKVHRDRLYLQGIDSSLSAAINAPEQIIQKGELLSITVFSDNPEATAIYNQAQSSSSAITASSTDGTNNGAGRGYLVDLNGNFLFHSLGAIHAEGLTKMQLKESIEQKLDTFLKHPYVEIRFLNKRVTVLGEVSKPGIINIPEERLNIFDALAMSGDMTTFGRKDNVLVIREENGKRTMARLNINEAAVYRSDFFYLHSGDLVYIEPIRKKPSGTDATLVRNISLAASAVSVLAILYSVLKNN
jgi:polysaccharide export outer membrane protein